MRATVQRHGRIRWSRLLWVLVAVGCDSSTEPPPEPPVPPAAAELAFTMDSSTYLISTAEASIPSLIVQSMIQGIWRPDGFTIAVVATGDPHDGPGGFLPRDQALYWVVPGSSGSPFPVTDFDWTIVGPPVWEPDGSTILIMRAKTMPSSAWIERISQGAPDNIYFSSFGVPPSWSHDGKLVATCCTHGFALLDPTTEDTVRILPGAWPQFSPVNDDIAFREEVTGHIHLIRPDSSADRDLMVEGYPRAWSPDGARLAFEGVDGFYTVGADGSGLLRIGPPNVEVSDFAWSADSKRIAYVTRTGTGPRTIYMALADDTERRPVVAAAELCCLSWRPPAQSNPNTGGKPTTTIAAQMEYTGR